MKNISLTLLVGVLGALSMSAQAPHGFKYQTVVRDSSGSLITTQAVSFRIGIVQDSIYGVTVFSETHLKTTNQFGIVSMDIGMGNVESGVFENINWSISPHFLKVEMDASGGSNYQFMGTSQLLSVPYSLNSGSLTLVSPNGTNYEITVDDFGNLSTDCVPDPSISFAGPQQDSACNPAILQANSPQYGQGVWSIVNGTGGSFVNPNDPTTQFSGQPGNTYTLRWTITNECGTSVDGVNISFMASPTTADAGPDQLNISSPATLAGNSPGYGTGSWSIVSGIGGSITDPSDPFSLFSGIADSSYTLRWTISTVCDNSSDEVDISFTGSGGGCPATVTDIDGNTYNTIQIGNQCWMRENLKTTTYRNGTAIPIVTNNTTWSNLTTGAYCWWDNNIAWKNKYGALYNAFAVVNPNGLCPTGWHIPSFAEWNTLENSISGPNKGDKLKSCRQENSPLGGPCLTSDHPRWNASGIAWGTDYYQFTALPGGCRYQTGEFPGWSSMNSIGQIARWWTSNEVNWSHQWSRSIDFNNNNFTNYNGWYKQYGVSVRCVKD